MVTNIQPASADAEPKQGQPLEQPVPEQAAPPASDVPVEEWDKERAAATIKAQRAEERKLRDQLKDYERLKADETKRIEAQMTEAERMKKQLDDLSAAKAKLETDMLRRDVIAETGLPAIFTERLKGATKEEMIADAKMLKESLPQLKQPSQTVTNPGQASLNETDAQKRERLFGRQDNPFDPDVIKKMGGGVFGNS
jgi:hypothetical protein